MLNKFQHIDIMVCYSLSLSFQCDVMMFLCFLWNSFINNCCFYLSNFFFFTQGNWHRAGCRFGYFAEISKNYWKWQVNIVLLLFIQHNKTPKIKVVFEEIFLIPLILKIRKKAAGLVELQSYQIVSILIFSLARELCFTGRRFTAEEALQFGFVRFVLWYLLQTELKV